MGMIKIDSQLHHVVVFIITVYSYYSREPWNSPPSGSMDSDCYKFCNVFYYSQPNYSKKAIYIPLISHFH